MKLKKIMVFLIFNMLAFVGKTAYTEASSALRVDTDKNVENAQSSGEILLAYMCNGNVSSNGY